MVNFAALQPDDNWFESCGSNVWVMDNHKWALWAWERHAIETNLGKFTLVHSDYHWDGGYDFFGHPEKETELLAANLDQLGAWIKEEVWIRYDSFIAPAVARGRFDALHFFCKQGDEWDVAVGQPLLDASGTSQTLHKTAQSLAGIQPQRPLIFDLCLDLFNNDPNHYMAGDLWAQDEIEQFLETVRSLIESAELVTVSLSFGYSGSEDDTRELAAIVVPKILGWRQQ